MSLSTREKIHSAAKIAMIVDLLADQGVSADKALAGVALLPAQLRSETTRVSAEQILQTYRNAIRLSGDSGFARHAGSKFCVSTYGMYGFAILSSPNFRETMAFAVSYHQLAAPLVQIDFKEEDDTAVWTFIPVPHPEIDEPLYAFIVELQMAVLLSLHRNIMGPAFRPAQVDYASAESHGDKGETDFFGCPVRHGRPENRFTFDAAWLDRQPDFGNVLTYAEVKQLCSSLLGELALSAGVAGKVREIILANLPRRIGCGQIARRLDMSERSLRRRLQEEGTTFRHLADALQAHVAIKYLRDTDLRVEDIACALGFSEAASFRHAFRRWTNAAPLDFRKAQIGRVSPVIGQCRPFLLPPPAR